MEHDVFISYSNQNKDAAQAICHVLEQNGIRCWIAPRDIPYGSQYGDIIEEAIKGCKVVVVLFSETAAASQWVNGEINVAFEEQKTIIPLRLDQTPLHGQARVMLNQRHWIDAYPDYKIKFNDLVNAVSLIIGKKPTEEVKDVVPTQSNSNLGDSSTPKDSVLEEKEEKKVANINPINPSKQQEQEETAEYVDLGLIVKWATCNIGASKPEEYGNYYAWGETQSKDAFTWKNYKHAEDQFELTKYCSKASYGKDKLKDNKTILDAEDDVATAILGSSWRMPTEQEVKNLVDKCDKKWEAINGIRGVRFVGPNGNSIFLPASGYAKGKDGKKNKVGKKGYYWTNELKVNISDNYAGELEFSSHLIFAGCFNTDRTYGLCVRPVYIE